MRVLICSFVGESLYLYALYMKYIFGVNLYINAICTIWDVKTLEHFKIMQYMETKIEQNPVEDSQIVNLSEDGKQHDHSQAEYERIKREQESQCQK